MVKTVRQQKTFRLEEVNPDDHDLFMQAIAMVNIYNMHTKQGVTYAMQGYVLDETGELPRFLIENHQYMATLENELRPTPKA